MPNQSNALPMAKHFVTLAESGHLPDALIRYGIRRLCLQRLAREYVDNPEHQQQRFQNLIETLRDSPVAIETDTANEQHYEVPTEFYLVSLGKRLKYSCAYYAYSTNTLDEAEENMLALYGQRAMLKDGQRILELGCGWGSLTLWMAEHYPNSHITAVSNSATQKEYITRQCEQNGFNNVEIITADVNKLELEAQQFDRVMSIEMFEHMRNYRILLQRISRWLNHGGKLFVHIFVHRFVMYPFEIQGEEDWMSKHFFTGGLMPAADTLLHFQEHLALERRWLINGTHYQRTCNDWLARTDHHKDKIINVFSNTYGAEQAPIWLQRWRMFYMACAELFGTRNGNEWMVAHYLFNKAELNTQTN